MRFTVAVWLRAPDVPVIVTAVVPLAAELLAKNVSELVPVVGFAPNFAVTPLGRVDVDKVTLPVKPFVGLTVIVSVPLLLPCVAVKLAVDPDRLKSAGAAAVSVYIAV